MKTNILIAALILTGCICAWGYLAAQSDGENATPATNTTPAKSSLLEIKEPSQGDFEHCAKQAMLFFESINEDQPQMELAVRYLYGDGEIQPQMSMMSNQLARMKKDIAYSSPELIAKKSFGENAIVLYYNYCTDKWPMYCRFLFERTFNPNGIPLKWQCRYFVFGSDIDQIVPPSL